MLSTDTFQISLALPALREMMTAIPFFSTRSSETEGFFAFFPENSILLSSFLFPQHICSFNPAPEHQPANLGKAFLGIVRFSHLLQFRQKVFGNLE
ncbi:MAG: hypothetical protein IKE81_03005 [Clostridia bacterium]|nr:hypothetical protein [Clostridia bacterium]